MLTLKIMKATTRPYSYVIYNIYNGYKSESCRDKHTHCVSYAIRVCIIILICVRETDAETQELPGWRRKRSLQINIHPQISASIQIDWQLGRGASTRIVRDF